MGSLLRKIQIHTEFYLKPHEVYISHIPPQSLSMRDRTPLPKMSVGTQVKHPALRI